jgi:SAM-dependent methyltransferase
MATQAVARRPRLQRQYVKLCDLRDFDDPEVRKRIREIVPGLDPHEEVYRKLWEYAQLTLFLEDVEELREESEILSVGAGHEEVLFWLTNNVARVVATDIYGKGEFGAREADATMLDDPAAFAPYPFREERLEVAHMDARELEFGDGEFDAVFSLSSIEHFGSLSDIEQAAREIGRVLRPGGYAFIVTECFVSRHPFNSRLLQTAIRAATLGRRCSYATPRRRMLTVFTPEELRRHIVRPSGLTLLQRLDRNVDPATFENVIRFRDAGELEPATGQPYPHILLQAHGSPWTSVALALQKT